MRSGVGWGKGADFKWGLSWSYRAGHGKSLCSVFRVCYHSNSGPEPPVRRLVQFQSDHFFLHSWLVWCHCYVPMFGGHPQCTLAGYMYMLKLMRWLLTVQSGLLQIFWGFFPTILCCSKLMISLEASSGKGMACKSSKQSESLNQCYMAQIYACNFVIWPPRSVIVTWYDLRTNHTVVYLRTH